MEKVMTQNLPFNERYVREALAESKSLQPSFKEEIQREIYRKEVVHPFKLLLKCNALLLSIILIQQILALSFKKDAAPQTPLPPIEEKNQIEYEALEKNISDLTSVVRFLVQSKNDEKALIENTDIPLKEKGTKIKRATVKVDRAFLRPAPSEDTKPLMAVTKGDSFAVLESIDDWNLVSSPKGELAWISSSVVEIKDEA